jgi:uncharacterized protein YdeI (YjbR/CyaY-like superfamily)
MTGPAVPIVPKPETIRAFASAQAFERWLARNHDKASELYLRIYKKDSGVRSIKHAEAVEVVLCWGWIDGVRLSFDAESFLQRFTPRKPKSIWSQINCEHVARLIAAGRMTPHGLRQVEAAKQDGRWQRAYAGAKSATIPSDLRAAIAAVPAAEKTFNGLNKVNLYALGFRLGNLKTEAGRKKRIESFVAMLARGETLHPNGGGARKEAAKREASAEEKTAAKRKAGAKRKASA